MWLGASKVQNITCWKKERITRCSVKCHLRVTITADEELP